jgi:predicted dehydrogenase
MQVLRVIHAGVGGRGRWPLEVLGADPRFHSVALVDVVPEHLAYARAATGLGDDACFTSLDEALATVEADALVICTPTRTHAAYCRAGFAAGLHVLVEKGMTLDWDEAKALVEEAAAAGVRFCVSQNYRYMTETRTLQALLTGGEYGTPHLIDVIHHRYRPEPRTLDYPFAMVWDMSCHHFDNLVALFGPVARVTAVSHNAPWSAYRYDAGVSAVLEFQRGPVCTYALTHQATVSDYRFLVQTEHGGLEWRDQRWHFRARPDRHLGRNPETTPLENVSAGRSEQGVVDDWYRFIVEGVEPGISGRHNLETLAVCEMVVRSATHRRPLNREELSSQQG